jgi:hypothetical protein
VELGIEFVYQPPETPCPPVSAQPTLASEEQLAYTLSYSSFDEVGQPGDEIRYMPMACGYEPAAMAEDEDVVIPDDHVWFNVRISLYPEWDESAWPPTRKELPVASVDVADWRRATAFELGQPGVWREGCGPDLTPCAEGEEPTVRTREWTTSVDGHVGNLRVRMVSRYIAVDLPPDAEQTVLNLHRDFLLWIVDNWEHADSS